MSYAHHARTRLTGDDSVYDTLKLFPVLDDCTASHIHALKMAASHRIRKVWHLVSHNRSSAASICISWYWVPTCLVRQAFGWFLPRGASTLLQASLYCRTRPRSTARNTYGIKQKNITTQCYFSYHSTNCKCIQQQCWQISTSTMLNF